MMQVFGGVFHEEKSIEFLITCMQYIDRVFRPLYVECTSRFSAEQAKSKFASCVIMAKSWPDEKYLSEARKLILNAADAETLFQFTFATYVKHKFREPQKRKVPINVRLSFPPLSFFLKPFVEHVASNEYFQSGTYFDPSTPPIVRKDVCMDACRYAFGECEKGHISVHESVSRHDAPPDATHWSTPSNRVQRHHNLSANLLGAAELSRMADDEELWPSDSVSQINARHSSPATVEEERSFKLNPRLTQHLEQQRNIRSDRSTDHHHTPRASTLHARVSLPSGTPVPHVTTPVNDGASVINGDSDGESDGDSDGESDGDSDGNSADGNSASEGAVSAVSGTQRVSAAFPPRHVSTAPSTKLGSIHCSLDGRSDQAAD